jgi:hypothetical protein
MNAAEIADYLAGAFWRGALAGLAVWALVAIAGRLGCPGRGWRAGGPRGALLALWCGFLVLLTLHPFPDAATLDCGPEGRGKPALLVPFGFAVQAWALLAEGASLADWARDRTVTSAAMNLLFFGAAGWLAAPWLGGFARAALAGLAFSLAIETTQATALWGLYPCPWRQFDVDDLILNTAGTVLGARLGRPRRRAG